MSEISQLIKGIEERTFIISFFDVIFLILPGFFSIFLFKIELFQAIDWIKLIFLSASITAPFAVWNTMCISTMDETWRKMLRDDLFAVFSTGIFTAGFLVYFATAVTYFLGASLHTEAIIIIILEFILFIVSVIKSGAGSKTVSKN